MMSPFEPPLQLAGTPIVFIRSLDDAAGFLRGYIGRWPGDAGFDPAPSQCRIDGTGDRRSRKDLSLVGAAGRIAAPAGIILPAQNGAMM
jgi:hypothetical protein